MPNTVQTDIKKLKANVRVSAHKFAFVYDKDACVYYYPLFQRGQQDVAFIKKWHPKLRSRDQYLDDCMREARKSPRRERIKSSSAQPTARKDSTVHEAVAPVPRRAAAAAIDAGRQPAVTTVAPGASAGLYDRTDRAELAWSLKCPAEHSIHRCSFWCSL